MRKGWEPKLEKSSRALAFYKETPPRQGCKDNRTQIENVCQRRRSTGVWQTWNFPSLSLICSCRKAAVYSCQIQASDKPRGNQGMLNSYKLGAFSFLFFFFGGGLHCFDFWIERVVGRSKCPSRIALKLPRWDSSSSTLFWSSWGRTQGGPMSAIPFLQYPMPLDPLPLLSHKADAGLMPCCQGLGVSPTLWQRLVTLLVSSDVCLSFKGLSKWGRNKSHFPAI